MDSGQRNRRIYMGEFNLLMGKTTYLPLVSGKLRACAMQDPVIRENYSFAPFLFHTDSVANIVNAYDNPAVATFSMLMWNFQLSLAVAAEVKKRWPDCLIVVGGASVPVEPEAFLAENPFIDITVRGEGEECFRDILLRFSEYETLTTADFSNIPGTAWRSPNGQYHYCTAERPYPQDLDSYPSPYLAGVYDQLMETRQDLNLQGIVETNRGCPFQCTFCYWGKGSRKYRYYSLNRVRSEVTWLAAHKVQYVFNADSNFGMLDRDMEIAKMLVESKRQCGYPEKFRTCYGKNTDEKIFRIGKLFHAEQMEKGITISYQSVNPLVQKNIKRENIKLESAHALQRKFNESGVPVYTELILGLPGETMETWVGGVDLVLGSGLKNQLFMYICQVYPNSTMDDPAYREEFGLQTRMIELMEIHGSIRTDKWVPEREEIIVGCKTMNRDDWRRALVFSWVTMTMHSLKLGFFLLAYLVDRFGIKHTDFLLHLSDLDFDGDQNPLLAREIAAFNGKIDCLLTGQGRGCTMDDYGEIYWDEEEASFLRLSRNFPAFYAELYEITAAFLGARNLEFSPAELAEVIQYQILAIPTAGGEAVRQLSFTTNIHDYFTALFTTTPLTLTPEPQVVVSTQPDFGGDLSRFARETILWGRKSGTMLARLEKTLAGAVPAKSQG